MRKLSFLFLLVLLLPQGIMGQDTNIIPEVADSLYREDQIYIGFTYNMVSGKPDDIAPSQFSGGFHLGFIRDFPLNERRNVALGIGLGWSIDTYGQNLFIGDGERPDRSYFQLLDRARIDYDTNRFTTQTLDLPIQIRWRTSTPISYKFWRVYTGLRPSYIYFFKSRFAQKGNLIRNSEVPELQRFNLGAVLIFGYNTFNFNFFYSLNSLFDESAMVNGEALELRTIQVGLTFFLL